MITVKGITPLRKNKANKLKLGFGFFVNTK